MIDRRRFLDGVFAGAAGCQAVLGVVPSPTKLPPEKGAPAISNEAHQKYLRNLLAFYPDPLGIPRHKSLIQNGLHPFAPGRMVVVDETLWREFRSCHQGLKTHLRSEESRFCRERLAHYPARSPLPQEKLDICVGLMGLLASKYDKPDQVARWSETLWAREQLLSTGIGQGIGLLHDFQPLDQTPIPTDNSVVDWWLIIVPEGVEWDAIDGRPAHLFVAPIMEEPKPGIFLRMMVAMCGCLRNLLSDETFDSEAWASRLVSLSPAEAVREVNYRVIQKVEGPALG